MIRYSGATYGYGRIYREYPQAQLQQQGQKPYVAVTQPTSAIQLPPWSLEAQLWAALGFVRPAVYLVRLGYLPPAGPSITFPPLGQWIPHQMDPPDPRAIWNQFKLPTTPPAVPPPPLPLLAPWAVELANFAALERVDKAVYLVRYGWLPAAGEPVAFPKLGQWVPTTQPLDESYYSFRLRLLPIIEATPPVTPWSAEVANWAAIGRKDQVVYLVRLGSTLGMEAPIPFPKLGQWTPVKAPLDVAYYLLRVIQTPQFPPPPPVASSKLGGWQPGVMDAAVSWAAYWHKLPQLFVPGIAPSPLPPVPCLAFTFKRGQTVLFAPISALPTIYGVKAATPVIYVPIGSVAVIYSAKGDTQVVFTPRLPLDLCE